MNAQLKKRSDGTRQVTDLKVDMHSGVALVDLIEIVGKYLHCYIHVTQIILGVIIFLYVYNNILHVLSVS